tara:strand:- start:108 stop:800 length:693 start_codon:yes stop_codon:yes gene_type:complete
MPNGIKSFISESAYNNKKNQKHFKIFGTIDFFIKDPLPSNVDILKVKDFVEKKIPSVFTDRIDAFYVGHFQEFEDKQVNAMYKDGAVYVSNNQDDESDMEDDIIHEIAHAVESNFAMDIYSDNKIQNEFLGKRTRLRDMLSEYGWLDGKDISFMELEYSKEFDDFLHKEITYSTLDMFCVGLFVRPYAATDLREYFATAFEEYFLGDRPYVKRISPVAYQKIKSLHMGEV